MRAIRSTLDRAEVGRFAAVADAWWDADGAFAALHRLNPVRLGFIRSRLLAHFARDAALMSPFAGLSLLDIGCGGGLTAEPMARLGFNVTGIDPAAATITIAREHAQRAGLVIDYRTASPEAVAGSERFDVVLALELIEHLADRDAFWPLLAALLAPGGAVILATLNRTVASFVLGIIAAEQVLGWIPRGTHDWRKFVRPADMILALRRNGLQPREIAGLSYDLRTQSWTVSRNIGVNYIVMARKL